MRYAILIPTYNEAANVVNLIPQIFDSLINCSGVFEIIVIDDSSPDGTSTVAVKIFRELNTAKVKGSVISREIKDGLGRAYLFGINYVLSDAVGFDFIIQMDSDLSHDPKYLPKFINLSLKGYDIVVGSRYIDGGGIPNWGVHRKIISIGGNWFIRRVLSTKLSDFTGGFNLVSTTIVKMIEREKLDVQGYGFLLNLKYRILEKTQNVAELPIVFYDRSSGVSKMPFLNLFHTFILVIKLRIGLR